MLKAMTIAIIEYLHFDFDVTCKDWVEGYRLKPPTATSTHQDSSRQEHVEDDISHRISITKALTISHKAPSEADAAMIIGKEHPTRTRSGYAMEFSRSFDIPMNIVTAQGIEPRGSPQEAGVGPRYGARIKGYSRCDNQIAKVLSHRSKKAMTAAAVDYLTLLLGAVITGQITAVTCLKFNASMNPGKHGHSNGGFCMSMSTCTLPAPTLGFYHKLGFFLAACGSITIIPDYRLVKYSGAAQDAQDAIYYKPNISLSDKCIA
ncbi:hypothetical protein ARMSODRAFT_974667 [Armillaria solidipes]|uniref:Uncharacterized protein n=1 Tax=Armillaria solidipes TaxID=1076256 RepID=A0A2H3C029_9AGAR|nr:hypothetical protein ARMSODRAFT_974667 [Armillaria solidipes]